MIWYAAPYAINNAIFVYPGDDVVPRTTQDSLIRLRSRVKGHMKAEGSLRSLVPGHGLLGDLAFSAKQGLKQYSTGANEAIELLLLLLLALSFYVALLKPSFPTPYLLRIQ